ncbi:MAG: M23 family metallopeptidase [Patescibacteria group bacterium]
MSFTIKRPSSKRFFQLSFEGFRPAGQNKFEQFLNLWSDFFRSLVSYVFKRIWALIFLIIKLIVFLTTLPSELKSFLTKKLIWSRGKLGRPIAVWIVMGFSFFVFMFGEFFSSSTLVVNQSVSADYLKNTADIIPKKELALTTIPEERKRDKPSKYIIEPGDSLYTIGNKFKVSIDAIKYMNGLTDNSVLSIGQEITIPPIAGLVHKVESGDTLGSIALKYDVAPQAIADFNYILDTSRLAVGTELVIPGGKIPEAPPPFVYIPPSSFGASGQATPNKNFCVWPTTVRLISQYYTWYHNGVDIATPTRTTMPPLLACSNGKVVRAGWDPFGLGLNVRIDHGNGYETIYGHMSRIDVSYGEKVGRGDQIGLMGSTGRSSGPHVHFMVRYNGVPQNPLNFTR